MFKKLIKNTLLNIYILFSPAYWLSNCRTNKAWDKKLNEMLDNPQFEDIRHGTGARIYLNGVQLWVENYPYAYGRPCVEDAYSFNCIDLLPSRKTRIRLKKAIVKYYVQKLCKNTEGQVIDVIAKEVG